MIDRARIIYTRLDARLNAIQKAVPPIEPEICHWLESDAGDSYCFDCAINARGREFELGRPLTVSWWYERDELEDAFYLGIGGSSRSDQHSDHTEHCATCGRTLSYILTDYGVEDELNYFLESPLINVRDEDSYALDRLCLNISHWSPRSQLLRASAVIAQAYRIVEQGKSA